MELIIGDRATFRALGKEIPVVDIVIEAAKRWLKGNLRFVDPEKHFTYRVVLAPALKSSPISSQDLERQCLQMTPLLRVGYYPLSPTEEVVLELERYLNSTKFKAIYPETGEDIKVMGLRKKTSWISPSQCRSLPVMFIQRKAILKKRACTEGYDEVPQEL